MNTIPSKIQLAGGHGGRHDPDRVARHQHDQVVFHRLLSLHEHVQRDLELRPDGIRARTRSDDPEVVALLHDHVPAMKQRLHENFGLRFWDPAFAELFAQHDKVEMEISLLPDGVMIEERSTDPNVVTLIQAHGQVINLFVAHGQQQAQQESPLPAEYQRVLRP
ncbi:hypothetical protein HHS34_008155 [Acidithiobacillus montserratensis]|uniref:Uncharacterized protein n=1 Tax=Acidithiobacillus montserratensis TaxID=2729135 RepID=A0ACD5HES9_9PROT|nr:hypothetical protein [Acidithiobacillus montserratensis]MBN2680824.1 hypothetical protein [Acidithiobacillaceae bacterium]MBU2747622.1 hypothetical protein [Acidithiobacillus montserratensis]